MWHTSQAKTQKFSQFHLWSKKEKAAYSTCKKTHHHTGEIPCSVKLSNKNSTGQALLHHAQDWAWHTSPACSPWCCCCISTNSQQRMGKAKPLGPLSAVLITQALSVLSTLQHHLCMALHFLQCWTLMECLDVDRRGKGSKSHHPRADELASSGKLGLFK